MIFILLVLLMGFPTDAFAPATIISQTHPEIPSTLMSSAVHSNEATGDARTVTASYQTSFYGNTTVPSRWRRWIPKLRAKRDLNLNGDRTYQFTYEYNELFIGDSLDSNITDSTGIMLIHPIGVGISKWYYDRLFFSLSHRNYTVDNNKLVFIAPDLLGSGSASTPTSIESGEPLKALPLLNITDWSDQLSTLMAEYESNHVAKGRIKSWVLVANGGCSPIALQIAQQSITRKASFHSPVTNVILSSPPRLPFFLESSDPIRVQKSYRTLSGTIGKLFWWYALRNKGKFIQKFSERNLVGDPMSLGQNWTPNCIATAKLCEGRSKYSTFAFLAGALQDGCLESLQSLCGTEVKVDFIRGRDVRRNRAKSWFWRRRKRKAKASDGPSVQEKGENTEMTIQQYIQSNDMGGKEVYVDGRISLAWEDADGYANGIVELLLD